jgi:hypothetical protein
MREVQAYLRCGLPEHGCALLVCERCGQSVLCAFSCKRRGFCPSCCGRRMNDAALHLTERVLPAVPIRQWVCSLPWQLRYLLGYDRALCAQVLSAFVQELSRSYRHRAKREHGLPSMSMAFTGSVTFVQRVDSALRLNVHAHTLALDGVYVRGEQSAELRWLSLPEPTQQDVLELTRRTAARVQRVLRKALRYLDPAHAEADDEQQDALALDQPALSACYQAAASGRSLSGQATHRSQLRLLAEPSTRTKPTDTLCAQVHGINIHASAAVPGTDRPRLERLCRYAARPPLAQDRLELHRDGRLRLRLKKPWADGTSAFLLEPSDFIARLVAAIPPPRFHMLRFHGVLAPHCTLRPWVVPKAKQTPQVPLQLCLFERPTESSAAFSSAAPTTPRYAGRHAWALLLRHVFAVDVTVCVHYQGRMRLRELCTTADAIARAMARAGLGPQPPPAQASPLRAQPWQGLLPLG